MYCKTYLTTHRNLPKPTIRKLDKEPEKEGKKVMKYSTFFVKWKILPASV